VEGEGAYKCVCGLIYTLPLDVSCHAASSMSCTDTFGMYNNMAATAHTHRMEKLSTLDKQLVTAGMLHFVY